MGFKLRQLEQDEDLNQSESGNTTTAQTSNNTGNNDDGQGFIKISSSDISPLLTNVKLEIPLSPEILGKPQGDQVNHIDRSLQASIQKILNNLFQASCTKGFSYLRDYGITEIVVEIAPPLKIGGLERLPPGYYHCLGGFEFDIHITALRSTPLQTPSRETSEPSPIVYKWEELSAAIPQREEPKVSPKLGAPVVLSQLAEPIVPSTSTKVSSQDTVIPLDIRVRCSAKPAVTDSYQSDLKAFSYEFVANSFEISNLNSEAGSTSGAAIMKAMLEGNLLSDEQEKALLLKYLKENFFETIRQATWEDLRKQFQDSLQIDLDNVLQSSSAISCSVTKFQAFLLKLTMKNFLPATLKWCEEKTDLNRDPPPQTLEMDATQIRSFIGTLFPELFACNLLESPSRDSRMKDIIRKYPKLREIIKKDIGLIVKDNPTQPFRPRVQVKPSHVSRTRHKRYGGREHIRQLTKTEQDKAFRESATSAVIKSARALHYGKPSREYMNSELAARHPVSEPVKKTYAGEQVDSDFSGLRPFLRQFWHDICDGCSKLMARIFGRTSDAQSNASAKKSNVVARPSSESTSTGSSVSTIDTGEVVANNTNGAQTAETAIPPSRVVIVPAEQSPASTSHSRAATACTWLSCWHKKKPAPSPDLRPSDVFNV